MVELVKMAFPIAPVVARFSGGLRSSGRGWLVGFCPFCQAGGDGLAGGKKKRRKFWVNPVKGVCACFDPKCQAGRPPMDVVNFYARLKGLSNLDALRVLYRAAKRRVIAA